MGCKASKNMWKKRKGDYDSDYGYDKGYYAEESSSSGSYNETESSTGSYSGGASGYSNSGGDDIKNVGTCWYKGITDYGIQYKYNKTGPVDMGTFITFIW